MREMNIPNTFYWIESAILYSSDFKGGEKGTLVIKTGVKFSWECDLVNALPKGTGIQKAAPAVYDNQILWNVEMTDTLTPHTYKGMPLIVIAFNAVGSLKPKY